MAVLLVLVFHAGVPHAAGGFVGVDVFFVISGFLIGGLLLVELERTGRLSLREFYARRARRILPSAGLVIVVVAVGSWLVMPPLRSVDVANDALASAAYLVNWHFVGTQTDYMAAGQEASPLLHYWSLAVEEQFYLVWPALLLTVAWLARRTGRSLRASVTVLTIVAAVGSFAISLHWTATSAPLAYMGSPARAWQFALGVGLALATRHLRRIPATLAAILGWAGLGALGLSTLAFDSTTPWPGTAALLPSFGAAALIIAGSGTSSRGGRAHPSRILATRPMRYVGRLSYSLYLWHWALLVLVQAVTGPLDWTAALIVVVLSAVPAAVSLALLETPIRTSKAVTARSIRGLSIGFTATVVPLCTALVLGAGALHTLTNTPVAAAAPAIGLQVAAADTAADPFGSDSANRGGPTRPSPAEARTDSQHYPGRCILAPKQVTTTPCVLGPKDASGKVVLIGDSHAGQWYGAVAAVAAKHHWAVEVYNKSGCPLPSISVVNPQLGQTYRECDNWRTAALTRLAKGPKPKVIFLATLNRYTSDRDYLLGGWAETLRPLRALGVPLVYLRDTPFPDLDVPACMSGALAHWDNCGFPRGKALRTDPLAEAIQAGKQPGLRLVDVNNFLCPPGPTCPAVRGSVLLYRDDSHLTNTAVSVLAPAVEAQLEAARVLPARLSLTEGEQRSGPVTPAPVQARGDWAERHQTCLVDSPVREAHGCWYGASDGAATVVLLGDSHAFEWVPALDTLARQHRWRLLVLTKQGCPAAMLRGVKNPDTGRAYDACDTWRRSALRRVGAVRADAVVLAQLGRYASDPATLKTAWAPTLDAIKALKMPMVYLRDTPYPGDDVPTCVSAHLDNWDACAFDAEHAIGADPIAATLRAGWYPRTTVVDLSGALCPDGRCPAVWGGTLAYLDHSHLTATFARQLAPTLESALRSAPLLRPLFGDS